MTRHTFTILDEHYRRLRRILLRDDKEYGALMLCGRSRHVDPWTGVVEERALVREIVEINENDFEERTAHSMTWKTDALYHLSKRAARNDLAICIAHSHPQGGLFFSGDDDIADEGSFSIIFNRIGGDHPHFSLVMDDEGAFIVRAYGPQLKPLAVELTRVVGSRMHVRYVGRGSGTSEEAFDRQARAFGAQSVQDLRNLRIGIVGCGGTGSAVATLLARLGVANIALFDADVVEQTNLNRLHFSKLKDAVLERPKVEVVAEGIADIGLARSVIRFQRPVDAPECRDAIRACDVIFGCTDDELGREFLNRLAHFYLIPVIDIGVLIEPDDKRGYECFDGRVTVVQPGSPCQICRGLISPQRMHDEAMRKNDHELYEQHRRAGYVVDGTDPSPVVVTFTTEIAAVAVNELLHRLIGFRGTHGHCAERVRRFDVVKDSDIIAGGISDPSCPLCGRRKYDGRGDMEPFLDRA